ncbi:MAG TPA: hypothetical protein VEO53_04360, partial [Candidatus Binatia bacterium]|nr:hypothetical protein [Candidatus Binatia bacterium]
MNTDHADLRSSVFICGFILLKFLRPDGTLRTTISLMKSNMALKILTSFLGLGFCLAASALTAGSEQNEFPLKDLEAGKLYGITVS